MLYTPAPRVHLQDPITEHADQKLFEWAWNNNHKIFAVFTGDVARPSKCQCGAALPDDDAVREHWQNKRAES